MNNKEYLISLKKYMLIITIIFTISIILGIITSILNPDYSKEYFGEFQTSFGWIKDMNPLFIILIIFLNNSIKSLIALVLGIGYGIIPILFVIANGFIIGLIGHIVSVQKGAIFVIATLAPHGIIELPMILLSSAIGLHIGHTLYMSGDVKKELKKGITFFFKWIAPLLFLAAIIETLPVVLFFLERI